MSAEVCDLRWPCGVDFRPRWPTAPNGMWRSRSGSVTAWLWDVHLEGQASLDFTIGNAKYALDASPHVTVRLDQAGEGEVAQDPLGLHPLYEARHAGNVFIANCPHRTAAVLAASTGEPVRKSLAMSAWLVTGERAIGRMTGYVGVDCAPSGARLSVHPESGVRYVTTRPPWATAPDESEGATAHDLVDQCVAEMVLNVKAHVANAAQKPKLQLTGGYDSRLVLALAVEAGVMKDVDVVTYKTAGDPNHPDVRVASQLAKQARLQHIIEPWSAYGRAKGGPSASVHRTAGMLSLRFPDQRDRHSTHIWEGLLGESLRSNAKSRTPIRSANELLAFGYGGRCILRCCVASRRSTRWSAVWRYSSHCWTANAWTVHLTTTTRDT